MLISQWKTSKITKWIVWLLKQRTTFSLDEESRFIEFVGSNWSVSLPCIYRKHVALVSVVFQFLILKLTQLLSRLVSKRRAPKYKRSHEEYKAQPASRSLSWLHWSLCFLPSPSLWRWWMRGNLWSILPVGYSILTILGFTHLILNE